MASLPTLLARKKEYPEMADDVFSVEEGGKKVQKKVKSIVTDIFYLIIVHPETGRYIRQAVSYHKKVTRMATQDILDFEAAWGSRPALIQKELYYFKNEKSGLWEEIRGAKMRPEHFADATADYNDQWRPNAYRNEEDPLPKVPKPVDPMKFRLDMTSSQLELMHAKEKNLNPRISLPTYDTEKGAFIEQNRASFSAPLAGGNVGGSEQSMQDILAFIEGK